MRVAGRWQRWAMSLVGGAVSVSAAAAAGGLIAPTGAGAASCTITLASGTVNSSKLILENGEVLCDGGTLTNSATGTITVTPGGSATIQVAQLVNHGTVDAPAGTSLTLADAPVNLSGTTLTGGSWVSAGVMNLPSAIQTLAASATLKGSDTFRDSAAGGADAFASLSRITSTGTFVLDDSAYLQTTANITSAGTVKLGTYGNSGDSVNWQGSGTFNMTGGSFSFLDGNACINVGSRAFNVSGGVVDGFGMLTGSVTVSGDAVFAPTYDGAGAGFWLNGSYTQTGGTFVDDVSDSSGTVNGGTFWPSGAVSLGGTLSLDSSGSRPAASSSYQIIEGASSISGHFAAVENEGVASFSVSYGSTSTSVVASSVWPPGAPRIGTAGAAGANSASVRWSAPAPNGGPAVNGYVVTPQPPCACSGLSVPASASSSTVSGLVAGTAYTFTVRAKNTAGTGVSSAASNAVTLKPTEGFWLATSDGSVFGAGSAVGAGGITAPPSDPVVGIAAAAGGGYYLVQRDGTVSAKGGARYVGDLPALHVLVSDIVGIAPTVDGNGYWLVGADGGEFAFGDARYHGSLPGLAKRVTDIVGMVATPSGSGYLMVGSDGGVFAFGSARYHGSLPGLGVRVDDIVGVLPTGGEAGYVLAAADGGAFVFGTGSGYFGSLPGEGIKVDDIVGLALTPLADGYWMAGADGSLYAFGKAQGVATPAGVSQHLPVVGIATA